MNFVHKNDYKISLNNNDYINVNGIEFENGSFYPNIRSIEICINDNKYGYSDLNVKDYIKIQFNVNLINLVSKRELNVNWFVCYTENLNNLNNLQNNSNIGRSSDDNFNIKLINKNGNVNLNQLYQTHKILTLEHKYTSSFPSYPIWHINGNHKTKASL